MTRSETALLLALAAAYDRRTIGDADVMAWQDLLVDLDLEDAKSAVKNHYRTTRDFLMPIDVINGVRAIRDQRVRSVVMPAPPAELTNDPAAYLGWIRGMTKQIADGHYTPEPIEPGDPEAVRQAIEGTFQRIT